MKHLFIAAVMLAALASQAQAYSPTVSWGFNVSMGTPAPRVYVEQYAPPPPPPPVYVRPYYPPPPPPVYVYRDRHHHRHGKHWRHDDCRRW